MDSFEINEIVVLIDAIEASPFIGEDVIVKSELTYKEGRKKIPHCINVNAHLVEMPNSELWWVSPECLRKKKPPEEDIEKIDWVKMCNLKVLEAV